MDVADLLPELGTKANELESRAAAEGISIAKTSGARGYGYQAVLYETWRRNPGVARTKYGVVAQPAPVGLSRHHPFYNGKAAAFDAGITNAKDRADKNAKQQRVIDLAREIGLRCGADWGDPVHFELSSIDGKPLDPFAQYKLLADKLDRIAGNFVTSTPALPGGAG